MICTDAQVRQMMKEREQGKTQQQAALKANVRSTKTVRKYERLKKLPSELKQVRTWRTRRDPFAQDWEQIEQMLEQLPGLEAKALFEWLQEQQPGRYAEGQLRTLQRRIEAWRAMNQTQVASLALGVGVEEEPDPERRSAARTISLEVMMVGGAEHRGVAVHEMPPNRSRALDFLNEAQERFFLLVTPGGSLCLNRQYVRAVRPLS